MSAGDMTRLTFVVVQQSDGRYLAYQEDKEGPAHKIEQVQAAVEENPFRAVATLCRGLEHAVAA